MPEEAPRPSVTPASWAPCDHECALRRTLLWPARDAGVGSTVDGLNRSAASLAWLPAIPTPSHRLLAECDEWGLRRLVHRHMQRLRPTPLFAPLAHSECFDCISERVADFVVESCGGPLHYSRRHDGLQAGAGWPLLLNEPGRELWLVQLWHSLQDLAWPQPLQSDYWGWAEPLSVHLLAPHARHPAVTRYPYALVRSWFDAPGAPPPRLDA